MLCFLFSALIVALDQFFKQWIMRTLDVGEIGVEVIPGVLGLTRWENDGAMLNILSGQQWLLAGIAFGAAVVLTMILLRYNEGFWGTIGLAAVLGGTVGNLIDRLFNDGKVVDMFRTLFIDFPIFNIADIFITLGFATFLVHFISISFKSEKSKLADNPENEEYSEDYDEQEYDEQGYGEQAYGEQAYGEQAYSEQAYGEQDYSEQGYDEYADIDAAVATQAEQELAFSGQPYAEDTQYAESYENTEQVPYEPQIDYGSITDITSDMAYSLEDVEMEYGSLEDYNVDDLLREYGFDEDE